MILTLSGQDGGIVVIHKAQAIHAFGGIDQRIFVAIRYVEIIGGNESAVPARPADVAVLDITDVARKQAGVGGDQVGSSGRMTSASANDEWRASEMKNVALLRPFSRPGAVSSRLWKSCGDMRLPAAIATVRSCVMGALLFFSGRSLLALASWTPHE